MKQGPYITTHILGLTTHIDSMAANGDTIFLGTEQGHVIIYSIKENLNESVGTNLKFDVALLRLIKHLYKKSIQQLAVIPELDILILLTDSVVNVHSISALNLPLITTIQRTKGALLFSVDVQKIDSPLKDSLEVEMEEVVKPRVLVRMCVAVKKTLQLYFWKNNEFLELDKDIILNDAPKSASWFRNAICVGLQNEYIHIKVSDQKQENLFASSKNLDPRVVKTCDGNFMLRINNQIMFINSDGETIVDNAVKCSNVPVEFVYDEPYVVMALNEHVEVRTFRPSSLMQTIKSAEKCHIILRCHPGVIYISNGKNIWRLQAMPANAQIKLLLEDRLFELALKLYDIYKDEDESMKHTIGQIQKIYANELLSKKDYREALRQFLKMRADPNDVIKLILSPSMQVELNVTDDTKIQNKDYDEIILALIDYLTEVRLMLSEIASRNGIEPEKLLQVVETMLLKCYLHVDANHPLVAPILRLNHCHFAESEKLLKKYKKHNELIILYEKNYQHRKVMDLLQKQAKDVKSTLSGPDHIVRYLKNLGKEHAEIILEFSKWVLEEYPEEGLTIFTWDFGGKNEEERDEKRLPSNVVLEHLLKINKMLVIPYLKHAIHVWKETNSTIHNTLIQQYREVIENAGDEMEKNAARSELMNFLKSSQYYTPDKVLTHFPSEGLYEERAILLRKLKNHEQLLAIYVLVLKDMDKAKRYCDEIYNTNDRNSKKIYIILLKLLIDPPLVWLIGVAPDMKPERDLDSAMAILKEFPSRIPITDVMDILPKDIPLADISHYLLVGYKNLLSQRRDIQIMKSLVFSKYLSIEEERIKLESAKIQLSETSICFVCGKRFGNQSAFTRTSIGEILHYSCMKDLPNLQR